MHGIEICRTVENLQTSRADVYEGAYLASLHPRGKDDEELPPYSTHLAPR